MHAEHFHTHFEVESFICNATRSVHFSVRGFGYALFYYAVLSSDTKKLFSSPTIEQVIKELDAWVEAHPGEYHPYVNVKRYKEILKNKIKI